MARPTCYRCDKPQIACICAQVRAVSNRTPVFVVQHPRERRHPLGTARIVRLGLERVEVGVTYGDTHPPVVLPPRAGLLHPDGDELRSDEPIDALVVIDGTWPQAKSLYRRSPWLQRLPRHRLTPRQQSRYRLRREPAPNCVSTVEAIVEALRRLEPETPGLAGLLHTFDAMIDRQIALGGPGWGPREPRFWGRSLGAQARRLVAVDVDLGPTAAGPPLLLHTVAWRPATGATFEAFVRPPAARRPHPCHLDHLELSPEHIDAGADEGEFARAWRRFTRPTDLMVAWSTKSLRALAEAGLWRGPTLTLKSMFRQAHPEVRGPLESALAHQGVDPEDLGLSGRAGRQLAEVAGLLRSALQTGVTADVRGWDSIQASGVTLDPTP